MEAVMILLGEKTDWNTVRSVIGDVNGFLEKLKKYDVSKTPERTLDKVRNNYIQKKEFDPEDVGKKSVAAKTMCIWVRALNNYSRVIKIVEPKKKKYIEVKEELDSSMAELKIKLSEVQKVKDKVAQLEAECQAMSDEKSRLEAEMERCEKRMGRAEKLVVLLADEEIRWKETVETLSVQIEQLVGNVFLSAAFISYNGAFTGQYRHNLVTKWVAGCIEKGIPISEDFQLIKIIGDPVEIRSWNMASLPNDQVSTENGILATKAQRWPLMIDPQQQANKWIKTLEKGNELLILKFSTNNFLRTIGSAVTMGKSVLIEDVEEILDPGIDPILLKQVFKSESGIR